MTSRTKKRQRIVSIDTTTEKEKTKKTTNLDNVFKPWTTGSDPKLSKCQQQLYVSRAQHALEILKNKWLLRISNCSGLFCDIIGTKIVNTYVCLRLSNDTIISLKHTCDCFSEILDTLQAFLIKEYVQLYPAEHDAWTRILLEFQLESERLYTNLVTKPQSFIRLVQQTCQFQTIWLHSEHSCPQIIKFVKQFEQDNKICFVPVLRDCKEQANLNDPNCEIDEYGLYTPTGLQSLTKQSIITVHGHFISARDSKFYCSTCHSAEFVRITTSQNRSGDEGFTAYYVCDNPSHGRLFLKRK